MNMLYTLNLYNVICQIYFNKKRNRHVFKKKDSTSHLLDLSILKTLPISMSSLGAN